MLGNGRHRLVEEWSDEEATFVNTQNNVSNIQNSSVGNNNQWCTHCSTEARMSGASQSGWNVSGVCQTEGCPGYKGHLPASRPQGN